MGKKGFGLKLLALVAGVMSGDAAAEDRCLGCQGPWAFEIGNGTFTRLYKDYYEAAVQAHCAAQGMTPAECEAFATDEEYRRTIPYYHPNHGILVTQAEDQLDADEASLQNLLPGLSLSLYYGAGEDPLAETSAMLGGLCGSKKVAFVDSDTISDWQTANPTEAADVYTVNGGCMTAVYCKDCYDQMGTVGKGFFNTAVSLALSSIDSTCTDMTNNIATLPPNAPADPECDTDAHCEAIPTLPSVDAWTNARCVHNADAMEWQCVLYSILDGDCPGPGSDGMWEWPCDQGLTCVRVFTAWWWWESNKYECKANPPAADAGCTNAAATNYDSGATWDNGTCVVLGCKNATATNYNPDATTDDGSCLVPGCTDAGADNYNPFATSNDGSCRMPILGCTDCMADNYDPDATRDDGSCTYPEGCTDPSADNHDPDATVDDGSCTYPSAGCTNPFADNYDPYATTDDGSCVTAVNGCTDFWAFNYDPAATVDDGSCDYGGCTDPAATNFDPYTAYDDGTCQYTVLGCTDIFADNYDPLATSDDGSCQYGVWP